MQGTGWLIVAGLAAVLVPALELDRALIGVLGRILPWPWDRAAVGALLFFALAGLYFRSHWAACQRTLSVAVRRQRRLLASLREELEELQRSLHLARDNLRETPTPEGLAGLYHQGAGEHAERALAVARRIERRCRDAMEPATSDDVRP